MAHTHTHIKKMKKERERNNNKIMSQGFFWRLSCLLLGESIYKLQNPHLCFAAFTLVTNPFPTDQSTYLPEYSKGL